MFLRTFFSTANSIIRLLDLFLDDYSKNKLIKTHLQIYNLKHILPLYENKDYLIWISSDKSRIKNVIIQKGTFKEALNSDLFVSKIVTSIDLSYNEIGNKGVIALIKILKKNTSLIFIDLRDNKIGNKGVASISKLLRENSRLKFISLANNKIGDEGAIALSRAICENLSLISINLRNNQIGDKGAIALSKSLKENLSLNSIYLGYNKIRNEGILALCEVFSVLNEDSNLTLIDLYHNRILNEYSTVKQYCILTDLYNNKKFEENASYIHINLEKNEIGDECAIGLSKILMKNTRLDIIKLKYNEIGYRGLIALSESLRKNSSYTIIDLNNNIIRYEEMIALSEELKMNLSLNLLSKHRDKKRDEILKNEIFKNEIFKNEIFKKYSILSYTDLNNNEIGIETIITVLNYIDLNAKELTNVIILSLEYPNKSEYNIKSQWNNNLIYINLSYDEHFHRFKEIPNKTFINLHMEDLFKL